jgi:ATP-dependent Clp protease ATP-binding subunit ClpC
MDRDSSIAEGVRKGGLTMFERFSERARRVLFFARDEASQLGSISIDTEHLRLGLLREHGSVTTDVLASRGLRLDRVREQTSRSKLRS